MNSYEKLKHVKGNILLTGPTGVGKSYMARRIHLESDYSIHPFIEVNLATLSEHIFERELFGHKRGAFTSADSDCAGYCEAVGKGTLFLDEVGELSLTMQKKLLHLLEEKVFTPLGANKPLAFSGRVIAATNKNLEKLVAEKKFREDLYFRLRVYSLSMPSLKEQPLLRRKLTEKFFYEFVDSLKKPELIFKMKIHKVFEKYSWPGNIRELKNSIEYLVQMSTPSCLDFPEWVLQNENQVLAPRFNRGPLEGFQNLSFYEALAAFERKYFDFHLKRNDGAVNQTAKEIGVSKTTLIAKARKYDINTSLFRALARQPIV